MKNKFTYISFNNIINHFGNTEGETRTKNNTYVEHYVEKKKLAHKNLNSTFCAVFFKCKKKSFIYIESRVYKGILD